jgi:hypothetical protein
VSVPEQQSAFWVQVPLVGLHAAMHAPLLHCCPLWQGGPVPHRQVPLLQVSVVVESQVVQVPPPVPQAVGSLVLQRPAEQQPLGQLAASQVQMPLLHSWPVEQGLPVPHLHTPPEQVSAVMPHFVHVPPEVPQAVGSLVLQTLFWQQPFVQLVGLHPGVRHTPPAQVWPVSQQAMVPSGHSVQVWPVGQHTLTPLGSQVLQFVRGGQHSSPPPGHESQLVPGGQHMVPPSGQSTQVSSRSQHWVLSLQTCAFEQQKSVTQVV